MPFFPQEQTDCGEFYALAERGLTESLDAINEKFFWFDVPYQCVIDHAHHTLVTKKSFFRNGKYPQWGQLITVTGKVRQITRLNGTAVVPSGGGMVEDRPFVDDPGNPALEIEFDLQIRR